MIAAGDDHREPLGERLVRDRAIGQADDGRRTAEGFFSHRGDTCHNPALTEIVIRDKNAAGFEHPSDAGKCLLREQVALEANIRVAAVEDQGVDQGIDDQVVLPIGHTEKMPAVVQVFNNTRILVRMVGMVMNPDILDHRIDFDGVDMGRAESQRVGKVVARTGADDQHIAKGSSAAVLLEQVHERIGRAAGLERHHLLVSDRVHGDAAACFVEIDRVIGRPAVTVTEMVLDDRVHGQRGQQQDQCGNAPARQAAGLVQQVGDAGAADQKPNERRRLAEGCEREKRDAGQTSADVQSVSFDAVGISVKRSAENLAKAHEHQGHEDEKNSYEQIHRHGEPDHVGVVILRAEKNLLRRSLMPHIDREGIPSLIELQRRNRRQYRAKRKIRKISEPIPACAGSKAAA